MFSVFPDTHYFPSERERHWDGVSRQDVPETVVVLSVVTAFGGEGVDQSWCWFGVGSVGFDGVFEDFGVGGAIEEGGEDGAELWVEGSAWDETVVG